MGTTVSYPLAHERGFPTTSRSRQQRELAFKAGIKSGQQALASDQGRMQAGQMEVWGKHWRELPSWRGGCRNGEMCFSHLAFFFGQRQPFPRKDFSFFFH